MKIGIRHKAIGISIFVFFTFLLLPTAYSLTPVHAAESSPSANIKSKLEQLKEQIASRAAELKQEISTKLQNKAYIGSIKTISENSITLASSTGPKVVNINQDTEYDSEVNKVTYSFKKAKEEDYIAALGDIDDTNVLTAKKIILMSKPETKKTILWGQVTTLGAHLVIKTKDSQNIKILIDDTSFQKGEEEISLATVKINDFVVVVGEENQQKSVDANFIYIIPQGGIIKQKKISTPSAQESSKSSKESTKSGTKK